MNCQDLKNRLSNGQPLGAAGMAHLETCPGCRHMLAALSAPAESPNPQTLANIRGLLLASPKAVRPLPSNAALIAIALTIFVAFSLLAAARLGMGAVHTLRLEHQIVYYSAILLIAFCFSSTTAEQMIPGAKRHLTGFTLMLASLLSLAVIPWALFGNFDLTSFVARGEPCLIIGTACAFLTGLLASLLVSRGCFVTPLESGIVVGGFSGLSGVAVLALVCPQQNTPHILVWHLGSLVLGGLGGALSAAVFRNLKLRA